MRPRFFCVPEFTSTSFAGPPAFFLGATEKMLFAGVAFALINDAITPPGGNRVFDAPDPAALPLPFMPPINRKNLSLRCVPPDPWKRAAVQSSRLLAVSSSSSSTSSLARFRLLLLSLLFFFGFVGASAASESLDSISTFLLFFSFLLFLSLVDAASTSTCTLGSGADSVAVAVASFFSFFWNSASTSSDVGFRPSVFFSFFFTRFFRSAVASSSISTALCCCATASASCRAAFLADLAAPAAPLSAVDFFDFFSFLSLLALSFAMISVSKLDRVTRASASVRTTQKHGVVGCSQSNHVWHSRTADLV
eukprot:m.307478 g.307478  ORF g.307478 m.307478 type:complete len:308 (-) comp27387_c0_seq1:164-1087(-)